MPSATEIKKRPYTRRTGLAPKPEDVDTSSSVPSEQWMKEEIERLQAENASLKIAGEARNPGSTFKEQWVRDPDVPEKIMDGDFHDISKAPQVNSQRLRAPGTFDPLAVSDALAKRMGINLQTEEAVWRRKDNWQGLGVNDVEEFMDHNEGAQVCVSGGKMHHRGDLVLCKRSRKYGSEMVNARINEAAKQDAQVYPTQDKIGMTEEQQIQIREENRDALKGILAGSITSGMSLERAGQIHTVEDIKKIKDRYLYAGRDKPVRDANNAADRLNDQLKGAAKGRGGSYPVGISFDPYTGKRIA